MLNDLEDIGQGQRSFQGQVITYDTPSHASDPDMEIIYPEL